MLLQINNKLLFFILICCGLIALYCNWESSIYVLGGGHDSLRYLGMAESMQQGQWLGEYNNMTLIRQPMYSLFLWLNSMVNFRLHVTQQVIQLICSLSLILSLRPLRLENFRVVLIYILCIGHPCLFLLSNFIATEAIYISISTLVLSGFIGVLTNNKKSLLLHVLWLFILSISLALFWNIRSEGLWILPSYFVFSIFLLYNCKKNLKYSKLKYFSAILLPILSIVVVKYAIEFQNMQYYNVAVTHENAEPNFVNALKLLSQLDAEKHHPFVPISKKAMEQAWKVSPHFAELKNYLSQQIDGKGWSKFGCEWMGICDEIAGGWTVWAIRDAAAFAGKYSSALQASEFFKAVAKEIQQACDNNIIICSNNPTGNILSPPLKLIDIPRIFQSFLKLSSLLFTFGNLDSEIEGLNHLTADNALIQRYEKITHDQYRNNQNINQLNIPENNSHKINIPLIKVVFQFYKIIQVVGCFFLLFYIIKTAKNSIQKKVTKNEIKTKKLQILIITIVFILSRTAIVAYIDAMSFTAQFRYLLTAYPAMMLIIGIIIPLPIFIKRHSAHNEK